MAAWAISQTDTRSLVCVHIRVCVCECVLLGSTCVFCLHSKAEGGAAAATTPKNGVINYAKRKRNYANYNYKQLCVRARERDKKERDKREREGERERGGSCLYY